MIPFELVSANSILPQNRPYGLFILLLQPHFTMRQIFPYQKLAQILIEKTGDNRHPYDGTYCNEVNYTLPSVKDKDRSQYNELLKNLILKQKPKKLPLRKRKRSNATLSFCKLIVTILGTIFMGICGITSNIITLIAVGAAELVASICFLAIEFDWWGNNEN